MMTKFTGEYSVCFFSSSLVEEKISSPTEIDDATDHHLFQQNPLRSGKTLNRLKKELQLLTLEQT